MSGREYGEEVVVRGWDMDRVVKGGKVEGELGGVGGWVGIEWVKRE